MLYFNPEGSKKNRREGKHKQFHKPKERKHLEDDKKLTRREFFNKLVIGGSVILILGGLGYILKLLFSKKPEDKKIKKNAMAEIEQKINDFENKKEFEPNQKIELQLDPDLSAFVKENNLSDLIKLYFDFDKENNKEKIKKENNKEKINPVKVLERLWEIKISKLEEGDDKIKKTLEELKGKILQDYQNNPGAKIKINEFLNYLALCTCQGLLLIDFKKLSEKFNFSKEQKEIIEILLKDKEFIKYLNMSLLIIILNEISFCSENNPQINLKTLEYLLNNFGLNFLTTLPAIFDKRISFGPFQLTDSVVGINNKNTTYPISLINECLNKEYSYRLPFKLEEFRKKQHYIGEFFLCLYHLCQYVKKLNKTFINYLKATIGHNDKTKNDKIKKDIYEGLLSMFCACHHAGPSVLKKFVPNPKTKFKANVEDYLEKLNPKKEGEFESSVEDYLKKAKINLEAIKNLLGE